MQVPLGLITVPVPGTPIQISATAQYAAGLATVGQAATFKSAQAILIQAWKANVGQLYVGGAGMDRATGVGVMTVLVIPTAAAIPAFGAANQMSPAAVDISNIYLDADSANDGALVTLLVT